MYIMYVIIKYVKWKLIYSTESSIYKENKLCNRLTDKRSLSVGPVVLTGHKGGLSRLATTVLARNNHSRYTLQGKNKVLRLYSL